VAALLHVPDASGSAGPDHDLGWPTGSPSVGDDASSVATSASSMLGMTAGHVVGLPTATDLNVRGQEGWGSRNAVFCSRRLCAWCFGL